MSAGVFRPLRMLSTGIFDMTQKTKIMILAIVCVGAVGCSIGNAPAPMSDDAAKHAFDSASPDAQIKTIQMSAEPQSLKDKQIADIEAKTGYKPAATETQKVPGVPNQGVRG